MRQSLHFPTTVGLALVLTIVSVTLSIPHPARAADISGQAHVIDGNTLRIDNTRVTLYGIDALELKQTCKTRKGKTQLCGDLARQSLATLLDRRKIVCESKGRDSGGGLAAICFVGPLSVNEHMVADGWALADRQTGQDFVRAEAFAKDQREGMWRTKFIPPWEWRKLNN